jgi:hypothetical protein
MTPAPGTVTVWATAQLPGFHRWPDAPLHRSYLRERHRHLFHVKAAARVAHDDRDTEFHDLSDMIRAWWGLPIRECGTASCEALARDLAGYLAAADVDVAWTEVSEDGESGAIFTPAAQEGHHA